MEYGRCTHGKVDWDDCYYKLIRNLHTKLVTVACLQSFDEFDYDQSRFIRNSQNEIHIFADEELAIKKLIEWFKPEEIDEEYRPASKENVRDENIRN